jgi:hypothetical protein
LHWSAIEQKELAASGQDKCRKRICAGLSPKQSIKPVDSRIDQFSASELNDLPVTNIRKPKSRGIASVQHVRFVAGLKTTGLDFDEQ